MSKERKSRMTDWDWTTLVSTWRYMFLRSSIASSMFPGELVQRYFGPKNKFTDEDRSRIAYQFCDIDYRKGGHDYETMTTPEKKGILGDNRKEFHKLWCFLDGWRSGFHKITAAYEGKRTTYDAFFFEGEWRYVENYIARPTVDCWICKDYIIEIDGRKVSKGKNV